MDCPYCRRPMKQGVVQSSKVVWFAEQARDLFFYPGMKKGDVPIIDNFWKEKEPAAPAYYCENCKKVTINL